MCASAKVQSNGPELANDWPIVVHKPAAFSSAITTDGD